MTSEYLTCKTDIVIDGQVVYPAGTLLRVGAREGDTVKVGGWVNGEKRKRWLPAALCCALPAAPEGEFWRLIFPHAPAYQARIFASEGLSGGIVIDAAESTKLLKWVQSTLSHINTVEGMQVREHGYILTLKYFKPKRAPADSRWYHFDFTLKGELERE